MECCGLAQGIARPVTWLLGELTNLKVPLPLRRLSLFLTISVERGLRKSVDCTFMFAVCAPCICGGGGGWGGVVGKLVVSIYALARATWSITGVWGPMSTSVQHQGVT